MRIAVYTIFILHVYWYIRFEADATLPICLWNNFPCNAKYRSCSIKVFVFKKHILFRKTNGLQSFLWCLCQFATFDSPWSLLVPELPIVLSWLLKMANIWNIKLSVKLKDYTLIKRHLKSAVQSRSSMEIRHLKLKKIRFWF